MLLRIDLGHFFLILAVSLLVSISPSHAIEKPEVNLPKAGIEQHRGAQLDLNIKLIDETGREVAVRDLIQPKKPTIFVPVYYTCPRLCSLILNGLYDGLNQLEGLKLGEDFSIVTFSFDSTETPDLAKKKGDAYRAMVTNPAHDTSAWKFYVGTEENVRSLLSTIGFHVVPDEGEWAHSAALIVSTPEGKISQYYTGIMFSPFDLRLMLVEASQGGIGGLLDHAMLFCFRFDESKGKYTWAAFGLMRIFAVVTLVGILLLWWKLVKTKKQ